MAIKMPTPAMFVIIEVPPKEIRGRGKPFVGVKPMVTAIFINAWIPIKEVIPNAKHFRNVSRVLIAIVNPLNTNR